MRKQLICIALITVFLAKFGEAELLTNDPRVVESIYLIETWIDAQLDYNAIPGMSACVVYDQDIIWSRGFGYADVEEKRPTAPDTIYSICSISKLFTSIGIMQLLDQGKLCLDDPIKMHLPWFNIQDKFPDAPEITIRGVLTHSSGLPREADYPYCPVQNTISPPGNRLLKS